MAKKDFDWIKFAFAYAHSGKRKFVPKRVNFYESKFAEPMRRALSGESGTMIGLDYKGVTVLAAYQPISVLNMGLVFKVDISEVRAPFIKATIYASAVTFFSHD